MNRKYSICLSGMIVLLAIDRISKAWATGVLRCMPGGTIPVIPGVLAFTYAENTGAAFGMLAGMRIVNALLTILLLVILAVFLWKERAHAGILYSGTAVMAGGISHLYDRLFGRNIIDFIETEFISFPIFNFADICICVGTFLLAYAYIRADIKTRSE